MRSGANTVTPPHSRGPVLVAAQCVKVRESHGFGMAHPIRTRRLKILCGPEWIKEWNKHSKVRR